MSGWIETHCGFVNTWECDENDHLNVQFYLRRFDDAARFLEAAAGSGRTDLPLPRTRHVRYHAELRAAATTRIRSGVVSDGPFAGRVAHLMTDGETGALAATALDAPPVDGRAPRAAIAADEAAAAFPRTVAIEPAVAVPAEEVLHAGGGVTNRTIVQPAECGPGGTLSEQHHIARFTDGAPHVWEMGGIGLDWLRKNSFGRVALEMKITHHADARPGDALVQYSRPDGAIGKVFTLRHEIVRLADGQPIATGEVVALVLDLKTRKSVQLPEWVRRRPDAAVGRP